MGDISPLFETRAESRLWYKIYAASVFVGVCMIWIYRVTNIPQVGEGRWVWMGMFAAELWFGFYWILTQSARWNPTYRRTFKERLSHRYEDELPGVDVFVCTADPVIEPPIMVINTVLSVLAYDYPTEKLSVYLSDDGGSQLTFYALLEASSFAKSWIPFCKKFKVEPRSPAAYFAEENKSNGQKTDEWIKIKTLYTEMENRINLMVKNGRVSEDISHQHEGFSKWETESTSRDHAAIVQIIIARNEKAATDKEGSALPTLVYMAREKRPHHHHNFKAGAMNSLLRVSSEISNGAVILNVDCDMYSNSSVTVRDALCFFMDDKNGHEVAYVQLPQLFNNITKNDMYGNSLRLLTEIEFHGFDGYGGPLYIGSGCFHRRQGLCGKKYSEAYQEELKAWKRKSVGHSASTLEERAEGIITCAYEDNTEWGKEMGLKYGCPVEDVITGLSIQCKGWKSIYFNPPRTGFLGVAPVTLVDTLVQHKRWSEGDFQIFLSKNCPFIYGHGRIKLGLQMAYSIYCLWAPCSFPVLYYVLIPSLTLLNGIALFPSVSSLWFASFVYVIISTTLYGLWEPLHHGYTLKGWWNETRMWMLKRIASYPFAFIDTILKVAGIKQTAFIITSKVADEDVSKRYEQEIMDFGSYSPMFTIIASIALVNLLCLLGGLMRLVLDEGSRVICSSLLQYLICGSVVLINLPIYTAIFIRRDKGRMPMSVALTSAGLAIVAYVIFSS